MTANQTTSRLSATADASYAHRLQRLQSARWKRIFDVQAPYRWHIRHLGLGYVLDIGCGIGRNLVHLQGNGIGVDHNPEAVAIARTRGLEVFTCDEWNSSEYAERVIFDSMLLAHVAEHMSEAEAVALVRSYLPTVRPGGRIVFITPQEKGYASDATHVRFVDFDALERLCAALDLQVELRRSFPMPRAAGPVFKYNEFVVAGAPTPDRRGRLTLSTRQPAFHAGEDRKRRRAVRCRRRCFRPSPMRPVRRWYSPGLSAGAAYLR